jgi:hypothetical protein
MSSPPDPYQPLLLQASEHLQAGRQQAAESIYRDILKRAPEHPVATHFLGVCWSDRAEAEGGAREIDTGAQPAGGSGTTTRSCSRRPATLPPRSAS